MPAPIDLICFAPRSARSAIIKHSNGNSAASRARIHQHYPGRQSFNMMDRANDAQELDSALKYKKGRQQEENAGHLVSAM